MKVRRWKYTDVAALAAFEKEQEFPDSWNYNMLAESFLNDGFFGVLAEENGVLNLGASTRKSSPVGLLGKLRIVYRFEFALMTVQVSNHDSCTEHPLHA